VVWRVALSSHRFEPIDPELSDVVLTKIEGSDDAIQDLLDEERRRDALRRISSANPNVHIHLLAVPNEGMMSGQPTNCYLLGSVPGDGPLTLVDTGRPEGSEIFERAFEDAEIDPRRVTRIVLTHCHPDHVGGAAALRALTGATVHAPPLEREQIEHFAPNLEVDVWLDHEQPVVCEGYELRPIFTPGHSPGHIAFVDSRSNMLLAGDMISGFGSVGIFPPNGSVRIYIESLRKLLAEDERSSFKAILPGHGPLVPDARAKILEYITHREQREAEIVAALTDYGPQTLDELFPRIYPEILPHLEFAGRGTLTMHMQKLIEEERVQEQDGVFELV
jgi:hydroxyacylglutathione hydrolase